MSNGLGQNVWMKSRVTIYRLPWGLAYRDDRENWFQNRTQGLTFDSLQEGEKAAEEAFHLTNAPIECLEENQKELLETLQFKGPSLSVGDVVRVEPYLKQHSTPCEYYLCRSFGWEKFEGDVIQLIKHLEW